MINLLAIMWAANVHSHRIHSSILYRLIYKRRNGIVLWFEESDVKKQNKLSLLTLLGWEFNEWFHHFPSLLSPNNLYLLKVDLSLWAPSLYLVYEILSIILFLRVTLLSWTQISLAIDCAFPPLSQEKKKVGNWVRWKDKI